MRQAGWTVAVAVCALYACPSNSPSGTAQHRAVSVGIPATSVDAGVLATAAGAPPGPQTCPPVAPVFCDAGCCGGGTSCGDAGASVSAGCQGVRADGGGSLRAGERAGAPTEVPCPLAFRARCSPPTEQRSARQARRGLRRDRLERQQPQLLPRSARAVRAGQVRDRRIDPRRQRLSPRSDHQRCRTQRSADHRVVDPERRRRHRAGDLQPRPQSCALSDRLHSLLGRQWRRAHFLCTDQ